VRTAALGLLGVGLAACASAPSRAPILYSRHLSHSVAAVAAPTQVAGRDLGERPFGAANAPRVLEGTPPSECVPFARAASGIPIYGDAVTWWAQATGRYAQSGLPAPGSVLVMRGYNDDKRGHVAVVTEHVSSRVIRVDHANWLGQGEISLGVPVMDVSPDNSWSQVRVWHIPGAYWGGRAYQIQGFIHPFAGKTLG